LASKTVSADQGNPFGTLKNLWPYMWPADRPDLKMRVLWASLFLVLSKLVLISVPYFFKWATDALNGNPDVVSWMPALIATPVMLVIAYNVVRIVQWGFNQLRDALFARVGQHAVRQLAYKTFVHMHELSLRFHLERRTGGLSRVIERGTKGIETIVRFTILNTAPTLIEFALTAVIFGLAYGWSYVLVTAITVWLYIWFTVRASDWRISIRRSMNASDTDANTKSVDSLLNFETVKYFGNEAMEARRFDVSMASYEKSATQVWTSLGWLNMGQGFIFGVGMTVMMVMSALAVQAGEQTIGDFVFINAMLMQLSVPLNFIGFVYREIRQGLTDIEQMFELLDVEPEVRDLPGAKPLVPLARAPSASTMSISAMIRRGRSSRASRSRFRPARPLPSSGLRERANPPYRGCCTGFMTFSRVSIVIDGQNVRDVTQQSLRAAIGMVPQDTVLFNDTIAYNIRYGRVDASDDEVNRAADLAQIRRFHQGLPEGFNAMVGERGLKLSGGEKQRVAIARTILKAPPILILDEATSALDTATEQEIQAALDFVSKGRTTLVIAHRLSTVVGADEIIVLKNGEIAERGRHTDLLAQKGLYASMWDRQREATEAEEQLKRMREEDEFGVVTRRRTPEIDEA
jgi:ABC-type transport system involved in Fe-S cluster assembly fused permease/ATPase subunit